MKIPSVITKIDPAKMRAEHSRVLCLDGDIPVTAMAEIVSQTGDHNGNYHYQIGLDYPRRGTHTTISLQVVHTQGGNAMALPPVKHWMTQEDFDGMLRNVPVKVPTYS